MRRSRSSATGRRTPTQLASAGDAGAWAAVGLLDVAGGGLAFVPGWSASGAGPGDGEGCQGTDGCLTMPFYKACLLLDGPAVHHIVAGRVVAIEGLPEVLLNPNHQFENLPAGIDSHDQSIGTVAGRLDSTIDATDIEVNATLRVRNVLKPYPRCPHPPRVAEAGRCERADDLPEELTLRIPSDWFLWPATGTSRRVARRAGKHIEALRQLDRKRHTGEIADVEHMRARKELQARISAALAPEVMMTEGQPMRLLEDRRGRIEVGGEYLFALGQREEGVAGTFYRPRKPSFMSGEWHVFWGDEARDVELAMMLIANCVRREPPLFTPERLVHGCMYYASTSSTLI